MSRAHFDAIPKCGRGTPRRKIRGTPHPSATPASISSNVMSASDTVDIHVDILNIAESFERNGRHIAIYLPSRKRAMSQVVNFISTLAVLVR